MVNHRNLFRTPRADAAPPDDAALHGVGCCPGIVCGETKVVCSPTDDLTLRGEILVAERTDPGWVPLYPALSGILIERGSMLSHSAVVAREMGIPTIVGVTGLTNRLRDGQTVRMDGRLGTVEVLSEPSVTRPRPSPPPPQRTSSTRNLA